MKSIHSLKIILICIAVHEDLVVNVVDVENLPIKSINVLWLTMYLIKIKSLKNIRSQMKHNKDPPWIGVIRK